jgi:hypothetical protein
MEYRGLILMIFGCSLMVSPLAIRLVQQQQAESAAPGEVLTQASANAACDAASITTRSYRLGCNRSGGGPTQRVMHGGASFVLARN